jgi:tagatose-1,6-bisphosphate aldolase
VPGDRGADRRGALRACAVVQREALRTLAPDDREAASRCRVLEVQVVQQRRDVAELLVDALAVDRREGQAEG